MAKFDERGRKLVHYPILTTMIEDLAFDSDIRMRPRSQWVWPSNAPLLEQAAASLNDMEQSELVSGSEAEDLATERGGGVLDLYNFLDAIFDGPLYDNFFLPF